MEQTEAFHLRVNGREYAGSPTQIVGAMAQRFTMNERDDALTVDGHIAYCRRQLGQWLGVDVPVSGDTEAQRAAAFVQGLVALRLATAN